MVISVSIVIAIRVIRASVTVMIMCLICLSMVWHGVTLHDAAQRGVT